MFKRVAAFASVCGLMFVAGCQSTDTPGLFDLSSRKKAPPVPDTRITQEELRAFCPRVELREGTAFYNAYERRKQDDPQSIVYQASIADVTRSCSYQGGTLTMTVAVAGKIVPGPKYQAGNITMPIRVAVVSGSDVVYSQLHKYQVTVQPSGATQFVFSDPGVSFPAPQDRNIVVFAGYDEGPYNTP